MKVAISIKDLGITQADQNSPLPLYHQVYTDLRNIIQSGKLSPGDMLPPELQLCEAYGVGRQTIRQAISRLVNENQLERFSGRGTFIRDRTKRSRFYLDCSTTQQITDLGMKANSKVLKQSLGFIDDTSPSCLQHKLGSSCLTLTRLRFADRLPFSIQEATIITEFCPGLEKFDFSTNSLYSVLMSEYHLMIAEIHHTVSAVAATDLHVELLKVPLAAPILLVRTAAYLENGEAIESTISHYRADRYEYSTTNSYSENAA
jgi:GntR family transcriptional regulator